MKIYHICYTHVGWVSHVVRGVIKQKELIYPLLKLKLMGPRVNLCKQNFLAWLRQERSLVLDFSRVLGNYDPSR